MAEVVKHGLIRDAALFAFLEEHLEEVVDMALVPETLDWLIGRQCRDQGRGGGRR